MSVEKAFDFKDRRKMKKVCELRVNGENLHPRTVQRKSSPTRHAAFTKRNVLNIERAAVSKHD